MGETKLAQLLAGPLVQLVDEVFETSEERAAAKLKLLNLEMQPYLAQLEVNKAEAGHMNVFVAGWRPFIGWVCGSIFAWTFIVAPFIGWIINALGIDVPPIPTLGLGEVMPVLLGLLGLGGMRTFEKLKGVESNR